MDIASYCIAVNPASVERFAQETQADSWRRVVHVFFYAFTTQFNLIIKQGIGAFGVTRFASARKTIEMIGIGCGAQTRALATTFEHAMTSCLYGVEIQPSNFKLSR